MKGKRDFESQWQEPFLWDVDTLDWLRSRPQEIIDLLLIFPPDCKVKSTQTLNTPRPHEVAIIVSHFENGLVSVVVPTREDDDEQIKAQCETSWLEVVEYRKGLTPEDIQSRLQ